MVGGEELAFLKAHLAAPIPAVFKQERDIVAEKRRR
jgi:hypothetical protein